MFIAHFNDAVFIAKLIDFVIFVTAIVWVFRKYLTPALIAHQEVQNKIVEDAQGYRQQSEAAVDAARAAIDQARIDSGRMVDVGKLQAARLIDAERADANSHAERILAHAGGELERERYRVRRELLEETVEQAHAQAQAIAKQEIDKPKQQGLVNRLIAHLERTRV